MALPQDRLTDPARRNWIPEPARGALHALRFLRADSAPSNIILFPGGGISPVPTAKVDKETEQRFRQLTAEWISETAMHSDPVRIFLHKSLFRIIGMGERILPLVLKEVERNSAQWFVVLDAISPIRPIKPEDERNLEKIRQAWIEWGKSEGLI